MSLSITLKVGKRKAPDAVLPAVAAAPEHTPAATAAVAVVAASALPVSAAASLPEHSLRSYTFKRSKPVAVAAVDKQPAPLKNLKAILAAEEPTALPNYLSIAAPPSLVPPKKYCDLTGFAASYTDPRTRLRYAAAEQHALIDALPVDRVDALLALRSVVDKSKR